MGKETDRQNRVFQVVREERGKGNGRCVGSAGAGAPSTPELSGGASGGCEPPSVGHSVHS